MPCPENRQPMSFVSFNQDKPPIPATGTKGYDMGRGPDPTGLECANTSSCGTVHCFCTILFQCEDWTTIKSADAVSSKGWTEIFHGSTFNRLSSFWVQAAEPSLLQTGADKNPEEVGPAFYSNSLATDQTRMFSKVLVFQHVLGRILQEISQLCPGQALVLSRM